MKYLVIIFFILLQGCASMLSLAPDTPMELRSKGGTKSIQITTPLDEAFSRAYEMTSTCYGYKLRDYENMSSQIQFTIYKTENEDGSIASFYMVNEGFLGFEKNNVTNVMLVADFKKGSRSTKIQLYYIQPLGNAWEGVANRIIDWASGDSDEC